MAFAAETTVGEVLAGRDLTGRLAVVTGASTGIGKVAAAGLAAAGAGVVLAVRSPERGEQAAAAIRKETPGAVLEVEELELGSLASVRAAAGRIGARHGEIDLLIDNAGVMATPFERTADGFELQFGTNHLGHFLFTNLLMPQVVAAAKAGSPARVVVLSSGGHVGSDIDFDDPNYHSRPYDAWQSYGQAKTANILFALELDRRYAPLGVHAYSVHPGMVPTELGRYMTDESRAALRERAKRAPAGRLPSYKSLEAGAATTVYAATAPELNGVGGRYLEDCQVSEKAAPWALDPERAARLWTLSEELVGERFPTP